MGKFQTWRYEIISQKDAVMKTIFHVESSHDGKEWGREAGIESEAEATKSLRQLNWIEPGMSWRLVKLEDEAIVSIGLPQWGSSGFLGVKWGK